MPGREAHRHFQQAARDERDRGQQADPGIPEREAVPDQRQRGALGTVGKLVDQLSGQGSRQQRPRG
ncbi:MAG: hypothetical protein ACLQDY_16840 [Streptosporangiaceae bacterium]